MKSSNQLKHLVIAIYSILPFLGFSQDMGCETSKMAKLYKEKYANLPTELLQTQLNQRFFSNCATYGLKSSYGSACTNDCSFVDNNPACNSNQCGTATMGTYLLPCKVWVFANNDGTNRGATDAQIANHINYINQYNCCNGIPIRVYQIQAPTQINNSDFNDCDNSTVPSDGDDAAIVAAYYTANILNIYIPKKLTDNGAATGCNGYAALPYGNTPHNNKLFMDGDCISRTVVNPCVNTEFSTVIIHELGHYLGLFHTHENDISGNGGGNAEADNPASNLDDCAMGDGISDTDADPDFSNGETNYLSCTIGPRLGSPNNCDFSTSGTCGSAYGDLANTPNTLNNIMSYNSLSGCRQQYTACQKAKMVDAFVCARSYMCDPIANRFFTSNVVNNANSYRKEVCVNGAIPMFNATNSTAANSIAATCAFNWYTSETGGVPIRTNTASFTPTAGELNMAVPGVYYFYLAEVNAINQDCRQRVEVTILSDPGDSSNSSLSFMDNNTTAQILNTTGASLGTNNYTGWLITTTPPTPSNLFTIYGAASGSSCSSIVSGTSVNCYLQSNSAPSNSLSMDCNAGTTYYAIPFASQYVAGTPNSTCTVSVTSGAVSLGAPTVGEWARINASLVTCRPTPTPAPNFTVTLNISGYAGAGGLTLNMRFNGSCSGNSSLIAAVGNGTFIYTQANFPAGADPGAAGICALLFQSGVDVSSITMTMTLNISYPGIAGVPFPTIASTTNPCVFGAPTTIACTSSLLSVELLNFGGKVIDNNAIDLFWETASEINNDYFTLQRSDGGIQFEDIRIIKGKGTTSVKSNYAFRDTKPKRGFNYYRLRQTDFDGSFKFSNIIVFDLAQKKAQLEIFPNPLNEDNNLQIHYSSIQSEFLTIEILDMSGKTTFKKIIENVHEGLNKIQLDLHELPKGFYVLKLQQNETLFTKKLTIK